MPTNWNNAMKKYFCLSILSLCIAATAQASPVSGVYGHTGPETTETVSKMKIYHSYDGMIVIETVDGDKTFCFVGEKEIPCFFSMHHTVKYDKSFYSISSINRNIDDPSTKNIPVTGICVFDNKNLSCSISGEQYKNELLFKIR